MDAYLHHEFFIISYKIINTRVFHCDDGDGDGDDDDC